VLMHDNQLYGLTKNQASPTSPVGLTSNTTPRGTYLEPLNPLSVTLGITNASFVAQAADWIPEILYDIISAAFRHKGFSFVRILQRCPEYVPEMFDAWINDPDKTLMVHHENGLQIPASLASVYKNREEHDPLDLDRAREIAAMTDSAPVGILYHNKETPRYDDIRDPNTLYTADTVKSALNGELDKYTIWPEA
ncbi:MAG: 2-oxoglutarate oxidoreductase, partial [Alphaproteobacteria bacterium]|nr:2-oxoglutarate oxidoreductase [Alphaproteobacteria bacterium]